jgi:hypothetical protein
VYLAGSLAGLASVLALQVWWIQMGRGKRDPVDLVDGLLTAGAVVLAFLAFDDITTDNATSFRVEYACLLACAGWVALLVARLTRRGHGALAGLTGALLLAALWGQRKIGPGVRASWQPEYVVATAALAGIMLVACYLVVTGARSRRVTSPPAGGAIRQSGTRLGA